MAENEGLEVRYIADVYTDFGGKFGIPRQSGVVPGLVGKIVFRQEYRVNAALKEIEGFSHLWVLFDFSQAHRAGWSPTVRPPRLGGNRRVGVFASRSPFRPNPIGLSCVKLERVEHTESEGDVLIVSGVDMLSGTPVIDIKPYLPYADCRTDARGGYTEELAYRPLEVDITDNALAAIPEDKRAALIRLLAEDPRPSYHEDNTRVYGMDFAGMNIMFTVDGERLTVIDAKRAAED